MDNVNFVVDSKTTSDTSHSNRHVSDFGHIKSGCQRLFHSQFTNSWLEFNIRQTNAMTYALVEDIVLSTSLITYFSHLIPSILTNYNAIITYMVESNNLIKFIVKK